VRDRWAQINYQLPKPQREAAFEELLHQSEKIRQATPRDAAALIWEGIVLSSLAGEKGGMGALGLVKRARADFEAAIKLDAGALDGAAYTGLGALYYQVPGWPLGSATMRPRARCCARDWPSIRTASTPTTSTRISCATRKTGPVPARPSRRRWRPPLAPAARWPMLAVARRRRPS